LKSPSVSRLHALIQRRDAGDYYLVDLGSRNGSLVNSRRVSVPVRLNDEDRLIFADQELVFHQPAADASELKTVTQSLPTTSLDRQSLTTIVVVDIRDFTVLSRTLSEALMCEMIGTWFLRAGQAAERGGSWARQYIGDAIMAVWVHDDPSSLTRDLDGVLRAVCEINRATAELSGNLNLPQPLRIGAGINTGNAVLGGTDYTALGDTVNGAFRLEAATKTIGLPVVLGEDTFNALHADPSSFRHCEVQLKGYEAPASVWAISFEDLCRLADSPPSA
jgi:adenylate cyclase